MLYLYLRRVHIFQAILVALLLPPTAGCSSRVVPLHVNSEPQSIVSLVHGEQHVYDLGLSNGFEWCMYEEISDACTTKERTYMYICINIRIYKFKFKHKHIHDIWTHN